MMSLAGNGSHPRSVLYIRAMSRGRGIGCRGRSKQSVCHCLLLLPALLLAALPLPCQYEATGCDDLANNDREPRLQWDAAGYVEEGQRIERMGQDECAIPLYLRAVELDPEAWKPRLRLGLAYSRTTIPRRALPHLEVAAKTRPTLFDARFALGSLLADLGQTTRALEELGTALEIAPNSTPARRRMATVFLASDRYTAAVAQIELALESVPDEAESLLLLGLAHSQGGHAERAVEPLERLVELDPSHFAARFNLATAHAQAERFNLAAEHFREALRIDPEHVATRLAAAKVEINLGNFGPALALVQVWQQTPPPTLDPSELLLLRGVAQRGLGEFAAAEENLRQTVALRPNDGNARRELGLALAGRDAYALAREQLETARELLPDSPEVHFDLIEVLRELGDETALQRELAEFEERKRLAQAQDLARRFAQRGAAYLRDGDPAAALSEYRQATKRDPESANLHFGMALALAAIGRQAERIESLREALRLDPASAEARNELGVAYTEEQRFAEAEAELQAAVAANPGDPSPRNNLGVLYVKLGRLVEAEALFRRAIEDDPSAAHVHVNLGLALASRGRLDAARAALRTAKRLDSEDPKADQALSMIEARLNNDRQADSDQEKPAPVSQ